ncbi:MAG: histidinol dehydrogenase [Crocinitomicaceae bacterium]
MKIVNSQDLNEVMSLCERPSISNDQLKPIIEGIFNEVQSLGDAALKKYTHYFDKVDLDNLIVSEEEIENAVSKVSDELKSAIQVAKSNIEKFHKSQQVAAVKITTSKGVSCWQESRAIEKVGIYIPGGTAPLFSTVLMLAVPAQIAGCKEVIMCTPPNSKGEINPVILYTANLCGITKIVKVGGAQAIAAMSLGTESVPKTFKIFGPGNQYVTAAKMMSQEYGSAIDMPAGPSELMLVADDSAVPSFVAADLLSQAEHGEDSQVICIASSLDLINKIQEQITSQLQQLPRKEIAASALENSRFICSDSFDFNLKVINEYAPEHLILCTNDNDKILPLIESAGSVFIGNYTPESAGDYASGTNHTLPTSAFAKTYSGVNLAAFQKQISFQEITKEGILNLGATIELMAEAEQLEAHKNAVTLRLKSLQ